MLDQQTRQQLQTKFQQIKPQLKGQFSGLSDQDWDAGQRDPDTLIDTISRKTGQGRSAWAWTWLVTVAAVWRWPPSWQPVPPRVWRPGPRRPPRWLARPHQWTSWLSSLTP